MCFIGNLILIMGGFSISDIIYALKYCVWFKFPAFKCDEMSINLLFTCEQWINEYFIDILNFSN